MQKVVDLVVEEQGASPASTPRCSSSNEWKYFASSEGSYIEQETCDDDAELHRHGAQGRRRTRDAHLHRRAEDRRLGSRRSVARCSRTPSASPPRRSSSDDRQAGRAWASRISILTPSHAMLTIHEIVAHATELDRILGYEANYAGTSFVKLTDIGKLKYGSKLFNVTADRTIPGGIAHDRLRRRRREDDSSSRSCATASSSACRPTARRRHYIGEKASRGCTSANSWRDYPFLRMPNVHVEPGPAGIADAGGDHRRHEGRRADRRPRQLLDRPAALQRPVRRQRVLGDQERQEDAHGDRRHLQRDHHRLLGQPRRDLRARSRGRCSAPAATPRGSRRRPTASRTARRGCGSARSWSARPMPEWSDAVVPGSHIFIGCCPVSPSSLASSCSPRSRIRRNPRQSVGSLERISPPSAIVEHRFQALPESRQPARIHADDHRGAASRRQPGSRKVADYVLGEVQVVGARRAHRRVRGADAVSDRARRRARRARSATSRS